jgi:hypothetical protein
MIVHDAFMRLSIAIKKYFEKFSGEDISDTVINYLRKINSKKLEKYAKNLLSNKGPGLLCAPHTFVHLLLPILLY